MKKNIFILSIIINIFFLVIIFTPVTSLLYKPLIYNDPIKKTNVIVILSSGVYKSGLPCFSCLVRLKKGLELYRDGISNKIICAGGTKIRNTDKSVADAMAETLELYNVSKEDIFIQDETINTYNDITYLLNKFKNKFDFNNSIFITSSYHTYRTKKILMKKNIQASVISAESYELYPHTKLERIVLLQPILREYGAICYFKIKGWI